MSEYLSEEEQIAKMKSWWDENGTSVIVSVVIAIAAIVGWRWYGGYSEEQAHDASRAYSAYQSASGLEKSAAFTNLAEQFPGSAYHVFGLFKQAQDALAAADLAEAETFLAEVVSAARDPMLADLARIRLAKVQNGLDRSAQALQTLEALTSEGYRAWGLEAKGDIHVARGELELAHAAYEAAAASLEAGDDRPILDMKLNNVMPVDGEYVQFEDTLGEALQDAQETLSSVQGEVQEEVREEAQTEAADIVEEAAASAESQRTDENAQAPELETGSDND